MSNATSMRTLMETVNPNERLYSDIVTEESELTLAQKIAQHEKEKGVSKIPASKKGRPGLKWKDQVKMTSSERAAARKARMESLLETVNNILKMRK